VAKFKKFASLSAFLCKAARMGGVFYFPLRDTTTALDFADENPAKQ
jgi:hypothetical protein